MKWQQARPVWDCRQQQAGDYRPAITERHFMRVPVVGENAVGDSAAPTIKAMDKGMTKQPQSAAIRKSGLQADEKAGSVNGWYLGTGLSERTTLAANCGLDLRRRFSMLGNWQCRYKDLRRASIDGA